MNSKQYLIGGAVVIIILLATYFLLQGKGNGGKGEQSTPKETVVSNPSGTLPNTTENKSQAEYTSSGFSPKSITVKVGTTVTWTNTSGKSMWVASNPHPTHQDLPGFDQLAKVDKDGTYSYTFTKAGSWKYHNHLAPNDTGVVIVQ